MPSLRANLIRRADAIRNIRLPTRLDQAAMQLQIITRTWSSGEVGADAAAGSPQFTDASITLPQKFPIRQVTTEEIASSGGKYELGDIVIEHITPSHPSNPGVGYSPQQLEPYSTSNGVEIIYVISGGKHDGEYAKRSLETYRNYSYTLVLRRRITQPQVF